MRCPSVSSTALIVHFMALLRTITSVELKLINTFGMLCDLLIKILPLYGKSSNEIHVIFENYKDLSPKSSERSRRSDHKEKICKVQTNEQELPEWSIFFDATDNKRSLQNIMEYPLLILYIILHKKKLVID